MNTPSGDEERDVPQRDKQPASPLPPIFSRSDSDSTAETVEVSGTGSLKIIGISLLIAALLGFGVFYLLFRDEPHRRLSMTSLFQPAATPTPVPATPPPFPVTPDMLHVTAIALGDLHLTVVNGRRLAEGDRLAITNPAGLGVLRVVKIEDGVVHFEYGGQVIDAKLAVPPPEKSPH